MRAIAVLALSAFMTLPGTGRAELIDKALSFRIADQEYAGVLLYDQEKPASRSLLLVPNWMGINTENLQQARLVAGRGYNVYVVDMYGKDVRPTNMEEAGAAAGSVKSDTPAMRARINAALGTLLTQPHFKVDAAKVAAIGFCFGGTVALELARSGAQVPAVVSFHGGLATGAAATRDGVHSKVLVLHGADDPNVPAKEVDAFQSEMRSAGIDWQLVSFGNAVHSFTDPSANFPGRAQYNAVVAQRAYAMMDDFLTETLGAP